ncbi:MAG: hypothetical protein R3F61_32685 [Myxococcota bacterium]
MNAPRRLKDDPELGAELGRALQDEQLVVGHYDLQGLRGRVTGGTPPPVSPPWWRIAAISGVSASLVTFALLQLVPGSPAPVAPSYTPELEVLSPAPVDPAPRSEASGDPLDGSADSAESHERAVHTGPSPASVAQVPRPPEPSPTRPADPVPASVPAALPPEPAADAASSSALVAELADYNAAMELHDAHRWMDAHAAWSTYLQRWPDGRLRTEARLGMLGALVNADRPDAVERLASELLATPDLGAHRDDLRLVRAEALVQLDRCDEALTVLEGAKRSARVSAVRSSCRKAGHTP